MNEMLPLTRTKLLLILHRAFVEARNLALTRDHERLYDLADTFEVIPEMMAHWGPATLEQIRAILGEYQARHPGGGMEYLAVLDMDEATFQSIASPANTGADEVGAA
jgi:hypothetical protein